MQVTFLNSVIMPDENGNEIGQEGDEEDEDTE